MAKPQTEIKVGIINEAYAVELGDKHWLVNNLQAVANNFRADIDLIDLLALSLLEVEQRLSEADVIFMVGGNADYLMELFTKTGFDKLLPKLLQSKVYVGSSAGSMVIGKRISMAAYRLIYGQDSPYKIDKYLGLVDLSVMPHLDSPYFPTRKDSLIDAVGDFKSKVYGLRDDSAVVVDGEQIYTVGSEPIVIDNGRVLS